MIFVIHITQYRDQLKCIIKNDITTACTIINKSSRLGICSTGAPRGEYTCEWFYYDVKINISGIIHTQKIITRKDNTSPCNNDPGYSCGSTHTCYLSIKKGNIADAVWSHNLTYLNYYRDIAIVFGSLSAALIVSAVLIIFWCDCYGCCIYRVTDDDEQETELLEGEHWNELISN
jgi:hypothetical protein